MTLFRYPGPCGLALWFAGRLPRLAPADLAEVFLSARPVHPDAPGAPLFGTLALLRPEPLRARRVRKATWLAENGPIPGETIWLPPSLVTPRLPWPQRAGSLEIRRAVAPHAARERGPVIELLADYLQELDDMRRSGLPGPGIPWLRVPVADRLRLLARAGVRASFSSSFGGGSSRRVERDVPDGDRALGLGA